MHMQISLDDGVTWMPAPTGVRVSLQGVDVPGEDAPGQLDYHFTREGIVVDLWVSRDGDLDHNLATGCTTYSDMVMLGIEENS